MPLFTYDWGRSTGNPLIANEIVSKREVNRFLPLRHLSSRPKGTILSPQTKLYSTLIGTPVMFAIGPAIRTTHGRTVTEMTYDFNEETTLRNERYTQLNADQKYCFDTIIAGVRDYPRTAHFFVHGPAGTGKTFLYKTLCNHFRAENKIVLCVASSGIAALLLPCGQTSHSRFKIPLILYEDSMCNITCNTHLHGLLQRTALII